MKYRLAIFDFDGTLADSFPFFLSVFNRLAEQHDFGTIDPAQAHGFRHYNARQMMAHVGLPAWKMPLVAGSFTALMKENAASIRLFEDIDEVLRDLARRGVALAVVTSNSHENVRLILGADLARLIGHFECGISIFGKRSRIRKVLGKSGMPASGTIYIGDQATDLEAAREEKVAFGAVSWGYSSIESLRAHAPEEEFDRVSDILKIA